MITIGTRLFAKPERREAFIEAGRTVAAAVREEAGCLAYQIYEDLDAPGTFFFYGQYVDQAAVDFHLGTPHVATFVALLGDLCAKDAEGIFADARD